MRMAQHALFSLFLCLIISSARCATAWPQAAANPAQDKDRAAIEKAVQNYMDSWNTHDVHAVAMTYAEDCDFVNNFGDVTHGRDGMEKTFGPFMTGAVQRDESNGHGPQHPLPEARRGGGGRGLGDDGREKSGWQRAAHAQRHSQFDHDETGRRIVAHHHHARPRIYQHAADQSASDAATGRAEVSSISRSSLG